MNVSLILALIAAPPMVTWTAQLEHDFIAVENLGDINADGTDDLAASPGLGGSEGLYCLDGLTGSTIWFNPAIPAIRYSGALISIPDINGDDISDLGLATGWGTSPLNDHIITVSGADGAIIWTLNVHLPVYSLSYSTGPPESYPALHASIQGTGGTTYFLALDTQNADTLWCQSAWTNDNQIVSISDFSGNGWDEIGICHDRGSASTGFCEVLDGLTGTALYETSTIYFGSMDLIDTPSYMIATGHMDTQPLWVEDMISSDTVYIIESSPPYSGQLHFIRGVTGGNLPFPVLANWYSDRLYLISGLEGSHQYPYMFATDIVSPMEYQYSDNEWKLGVLTTEAFYISEPAIYGPAPGDHCPLPGQPGKDICLLNSDIYPTPLAGVAMTAGLGPGLCAIATSWPTGIEEHSGAPVVPSIRLLSNPGTGGVLLQIDDTPANVLVLDITGRLVQRIHQREPTVLFVPLPTGVYHLIDQDTFAPILRAIVLPSQP